MASVDFSHMFIKILWRLFQLHLLLFVQTYAFNVKTSNANSVCQRSGCPIVRVKQYLHYHASLLGQSFRLNRVGAHAQLGSSSLSMALHLGSALRSPQSMALYMSSCEAMLALPTPTNTVHQALKGSDSDTDANYHPVSDPSDYVTPQLEVFSATKQKDRPSTALTTIAQYYESNYKLDVEGGKSVSKTKGKSYVNPGDLEVMVIGLSHHNAGVDVREKLAIPDYEWRAVASELARLPHVHEASVLSTCNRFEIYLAVDNVKEGMEEAINFLIERSKQSLDRAMLQQVLFMLTGEEAIWHLLRVSAGLDSLVVGEGQILSQVKKSYELCSLSENTIVSEDSKNNVLENNSKNEPSPAGKILTRLLNTAVTAGKRARAETGIAKGAVSISSAAAQFTAQHVAKDCLIEHIKDAKICIIGSGKMSRLLLVHLATEGVQEVTVVNRSPNRIDELRAEFPNINIKFELMDKLWDVIAESDVVFPSTSSKITIIDPEPLMHTLERRKRPGGLQFIDISVPRNVHPDCSRIPGVFNYNVDFLKAAVDRNTAMRQREILEVENLLSDELDKFQIWKQSLIAVPTIKKLQEMGEGIRKAELEKITASLGNKLEPNELKMIEKMSRGIVSKLLHGPLKLLRTQNKCVGDECLDAKNTVDTVTTIRKAFQLESQ